jgi:multiple sugar transport system substrate-binding protein
MALDKDQQLRAFRGLDAFPALITAQDDPFVDQPIPFLGDQKARQLWKEAASRIPATAVSRHDATANDIVNAELTNVLEKNKDIKTALADAKKQIERRMRR